MIQKRIYWPFKISRILPINSKRCGKEFEVQKVSTQFCSKRCAEHAYKERKRQEKKKRVEIAEVERITLESDKNLQKITVAGDWAGNRMRGHGGGILYEDFIGTGGAAYDVERACF